MELHMHSHHVGRRLPEWPAAVIGGCLAGAVFLVIELFAMRVAGQSLWVPLRMIAGIAMGRDALQAAPFEPGVVVVALVTHFVLSIFFAIILAVIMAPFSLDSSVGLASLVGLLFGVLLYVVNFYGMTQIFPWFVDARGWLSCLSHMMFGLVAADACLALEGRESDGDGATGAG